ncbi:predicted protein [Nematostella vectensis]|uniref:BHLH domain-containing protein n=1 Tax=Nematostella vectensis TaxID=45351 RepID=A7SZM2_NEMVE|nr:predicted protein [Nematostella vectensis]|eukprot:XP_001622931.1 predicted protein [Nematostella vectensis]
MVYTPSNEEQNYEKIFTEQATEFPWSLFEKAAEITEDCPRESKRTKLTVPPTVRRFRQLRRNARERERQGRLNSAFDVLRGVIPDYLSGKGPERKLTQIETLRLATHYIMALSEMLEDENQKSSDCCECGHTYSRSSPNTE